MVKAVSFKKMKMEKGFNCWGENHGAEGILTFKNGDEIPSCLNCAKCKWKFKRNRKGWLKLLDKHKSLNIRGISSINNDRQATLGGRNERKILCTVQK